MRFKSMSLWLALLLATPAVAAPVVLKKPADPYFAEFQPLKSAAPAQTLRKNDRLAICGDSITEQRMYSRIMETYLTVCAPELNVSVRQFGWGGERAPGFLARMTNDCLRFKPTIATTCYGMNDHEYRPYEERIGRTYRDAIRAIVRAFNAHGARVVIGSPGCVGRRDKWSAEALNLNLCRLRNLALEVAEQERAGFADVFWPMLTAGYSAQLKHGDDYAIAGSDAVHPDWAGHLVMAHAFLTALGLDGDLGIFTLDLKTNKTEKATVSKGHKVLSERYGEMEIQSLRYPFVIGRPQPPKSTAKDEDANATEPEGGEEEKDEAKAEEKRYAREAGRHDNIYSGTTLVPFNEKLNRLKLVVKNPQAPKYRVEWDGNSKVFEADDLKKGINLAAEFPMNPFSQAFRRVDEAVARKQEFETRQIKKLFRSDEAKADMNRVVNRTEQERASLVDAIKAAFVPVTHTIKLNVHHGKSAPSDSRKRKKK